MADHCLRALPVPLLLLGADNIIWQGNDAADALFGRPPGGIALTAFLAPECRLFSLLAQARADGPVIHHDLVLEGPRLPARRVLAALAPAAEGAGAVCLMLFPLPAEGRSDRGLRSVSAMAAMLAHEIKNPLFGIRGAAQLLEQEAGAGGRDLSRLIQEESDRIRVIVDKVELLSEDRLADPQPVNLHLVLDRVLAAAAAGFAKGTVLQRAYDPSLPPARGDFGRLVQVFMNLVKNAAEAGGTEITLRTSWRRQASRPAPGGRSEPWLPLVVQIIDNGPGVPEGLRAHLFDPFVTTRAGGNGLGLALVAKLVADHGGTVDCDSRPGRTIFTVALPVFQGSERP